MRTIGCDLHATQQTIAVLDRETGEVVERKLTHDGTTVRDFYASHRPWWSASKPRDRCAGLCGRWRRLGITCQVSDPAKIRSSETRRQRHDRRDA